MTAGPPVCGRHNRERGAGMEAGMEVRRRESPFDLLQHDHYTVDEVARLLDISVHIVQHAAFSGELRAQILGHHILSLRREDVVTWFIARDVRADLRPVQRAPQNSTRLKG
jgi:excisionase family DNA binding protein